MPTSLYPKDEMPNEAGEDEDTITSAVTVSESNPIRDVFGPSAKVLGLFLGKQTQAWVDDREARRAENARNHFEKVKRVEKFSDPTPAPSERQAAMLVDWVERAQTIDPESEDDLAALWQATLAGIFRNESDSEELMKALKQLNRSQAKLLLQTPSGWFRPLALDDANLQKFKSIGLLSPYRLSHSSDIIPTSVMLGLCFAAFMIFYVSTTLIEGAPVAVYTMRDLQMFRVLSLVFGSSFLFGLAYLALSRVGTYRLSRVGRKLRDEGRKYWTNETSA